MNYTKAQAKMLAYVKQQGGTYNIQDTISPQLPNSNVRAVPMPLDFTNVERIQNKSNNGYGKMAQNVDDTIRRHSWFFDSEDKVNKFKQSVANKDGGAYVKEFQKAYNNELNRRASEAGLPEEEVKNLISTIGFAEEGIRKKDGKFGAFTSSRPIIDFKRPVGEPLVMEDQPQSKMYRVLYKVPNLKGEPIKGANDAINNYFKKNNVQLDSEGFAIVDEKGKEFVQSIVDRHNDGAYNGTNNRYGEVGDERKGNNADKKALERQNKLKATIEAYAIENKQQGGKIYAQQGLNKYGVPPYSTQEDSPEYQAYNNGLGLPPMRQSDPQKELNSALDPNNFNQGEYLQSANQNPAPIDYNANYMNMDIEEENLQKTNGVQTTKYIDNNRIQIYQPYGGVGLEQSLYTLGQGLGEKDPWKTGVGAGLSALKLARTGLSGYASGKENRRVGNAMYKDLWKDNRRAEALQQGGEIKVADVMTGGYLTDEGEGNVELEGREHVKNNQTGDIQKVIGDRHKDGGVTATLEDAKVLSDYTKIGAKNAKELKDRYNISVKKEDTFAKVMDKVNKKIGVTETLEELSSYIEKIGKNERVKDKATKALNESSLTKEIQEQQSKLNELKTAQNFIFEDIFSRQEAIPKKGKPGEILDEKGNPMQKGEDGKYYQQGGNISELAKQFGLSPERAQELIQMQQGGQQESQIENNQEEVDANQIAEALQQGADPNQVIQQLLEMGVPQEQAVQLVQSIMEQIQAPQQGGDMNQVMQQVAQAIQQGADPNEVAQQLIQSGIPQEQVVQIIEQVMAQMQPEQQMQQGGKIYAQQGEIIYNSTTGRNEYRTNSRVKQRSTKDGAYGDPDPEIALQRLYNNFPDIVSSKFKDNIEVDELGNVRFKKNLPLNKEQEIVRDFQKQSNSRMRASADVILKNPKNFSPEQVKEAQRYLNEETFLDTTPGAEDEANSIRGFDAKLGNFTSGRYSMGVDLLTPEDLKKAQAKGIKTLKQLKESDLYSSLSKDSKKRVDNMSSLVGNTDADFSINEFNVPQPTGNKYAEVPLDNVRYETRDNVKTVMPNLPVDFILPPRAMNAIAKPYVPLGRIEPIKITPEPMLAEQERQRLTAQEQVTSSGLAPQVQQALLAQQLGAGQMAANDAISKSEQYNAQNQFQTDQFNIGQSDKEKILNENFNMKYQDQMMSTIANQERDNRRYFNELNDQQWFNYNWVDRRNILNAANDKFQTDGNNIYFMGNTATDMGQNNISQNDWDKMTAQEQIAYREALQRQKQANMKQTYGNS